MKREVLEKLGLEKDAIDSIMKEFGKVNTALNDAETKVEELTGQIAKRDEDIETLKKEATDNVELSEKYSSLQKQYEQDKTDFEAKMTEEKINHAIELSLNGKVHDLDIVKSLVSKENLKFGEDGSLDGLNEQIETLKESKGFLFVDETKVQEPNDPQPHIVGATPKGTSAPSENANVNEQHWMDVFTSDIQN